MYIYIYVTEIRQTIHSSANDHWEESRFLNEATQIHHGIGSFSPPKWSPLKIPLLNWCLPGSMLGQKHPNAVVQWRFEMLPPYFNDSTLMRFQFSVCIYIYFFIYMTGEDYYHIMPTHIC